MSSGISGPGRAERGFGAVCPTQAARDEQDKVSHVHQEFHVAFSNQANDFRLTLWSGELDWSAFGELAKKFPQGCAVYEVIVQKNHTRRGALHQIHQLRQIARN